MPLSAGCLLVLTLRMNCEFQSNFLLIHALAAKAKPPLTNATLKETPLRPLNLQLHMSN